MDKTYIINIALCLTYYHMGGLATTNIERLCKGSELKITDKNCFCPVCGNKISWFLQLPIISYIICRGKCKNCSSKIPIKSLILEILVFTVMTVISAIFNFNHIGVLLSFCAYEIIKLIWLKLNGKREKNFKREYIVSVLLNVIFLIMAEFMALLKLYI